MPSDFLDLTAPSLANGRGKTPDQLPHGVLTPPEEVLKFVAKEDARLLRDHHLAVTAEARQRLTNDLTVHHYFDYLGHQVAYRNTPAGPEVLAVGIDEVSKLLEGMSLDQVAQLHVRQF